MNKTVVHFEIGCSDLDSTSQFYKTIFNWDLVKHGNSALINPGENDALPGHINQLGPNDPQNYVTVYIQTPTLESDLKNIVSHGGEIIVPETSLPDGRHFAWFKDIAGNTMGLITPKPKK